MKLTQTVLALTCAFLSQLSIASDDDYDSKKGKHLFQTHCVACHGSTGGMDMSKRVAPPIAAVRSHYIGSFPDEDSFVMAVANWVEKQDANNSLMRGAIRRFKIMPPVAVSKTDAENIAAYIYAGDIGTPEGMDDHIQQRHNR